MSAIAIIVSGRFRLSPCATSVQMGMEYSLMKVTISRNGILLPGPKQTREKTCVWRRDRERDRERGRERQAGVLVEAG